MGTKRWLDSLAFHQGKTSGDALVALLNNPQINHDFVEQLLADAQVVCGWWRECGSLRKFARSKLPANYEKASRRLNKTLATFTHAPRVDVHAYYDGNPVFWAMVTEQSPIALLSAKVRTVLHVLSQGAILKVRRCQQCPRWFFARVSQQSYCSAACRGKHFSTSETFKANRRAYMRNYYHLKKSGKVK